MTPPFRLSWFLIPPLLLALAAPGCGDDGSSGTAGSGGTTTTPAGGGGTGGDGGDGGAACPADDQNDCTDDVCSPDGTTVHDPLPPGEPCAQGVCDGIGTCIECLDDAQCTAPKVCDKDQNKCVDPTCEDGQRNGEETDVDCGGPACPGCMDGQGCEVGADCASLVCAQDEGNNLVCQTASCADTVKNGDETDVDCGGSCAAACPDGSPCVVADDCQSGVCSASLTCAAATCGDGVVNGDDGCDDGNAVDGDGCDSNCKPTGCGNGVVTAGELCDDRNSVNGDGCDNNCTLTGCGNGIVTGTEACDDANLLNGDGCDDNCTLTGCGNGIVTAGELCDDANLESGDGCDSNCTLTACGNGVVTNGEACDDGNAIEGDGCDSNCTLTACGNGVVSGSEICDDGNATEGDGCDSNCTPTGCGNGIVTGTELCDDGNLVNGDGCDVNCTASGCGNGVASPGEECDDGNAIEGDGCDSNCTATGCGNGIATPGEPCDDGNAATGDGCTPACAVEPGYSCAGSPSVCVPDEIFCNDGIDNNGVAGPDAQDPSCQLPAYVPPCGPGQQLRVYSNNTPGAIPDNNTTGITRSVEVTGGGLVVGGAILFNITHTFDGDLDISFIPPNGTAIDVCSDNGGANDNFVDTVLSPVCAASVTTGAAPFSGCYAPENVAQVAALAGTTADGTWSLQVVDDAASDLGTLHNWRFILCTTVCGDGMTVAPETCDDGNTDDGDGCDSNCLLTACGNGIVTDGEQCDDGNAINGDGCDSNCTPSACGNSVVGGAETCDDGNAIDGDGCDSNCTLTGCGNGIVTDGEQCDDGNSADNDGCTNACTLPACGDGALATNEQCDDGNSDDGDGCSSGCVVEPFYQCTRGTTPSNCVLQESACNDGADGDGDGLIDAADPDCQLPAYFLPCAAGEELHVYRSRDVPQAIPDADPIGVTMSVAATLGGTVQKAALLFDITHTWNSDVDLFLIPPGGAQMDVCTDNGSSADNFTSTILDTNCAAPVTGGVAPFAGCYTPETSFATLTGTPADGLWSFQAVDDLSSFVGTVNSWAMILCTTP